MTGKKLLLALITVAAAMLALSSCGPRYKTFYSYTPPSDPMGKNCIMQCDMIQTQCEQMEEMKLDQCEFKAELEYKKCKKSGGESCYQSACHTEFEHCKDKYNTCYQNCGGKVKADVICVGNCDKK